MKISNTLFKTFNIWLRSASRGVVLALICFHLAFLGTPLVHAQSQAAMTGNPEAPKTIEEQKAACTAADKYWDTQLNSCMTKQEAIDTANQAKACADAADPDSCFMDEAEKKSGVESGDKFQNNNMEMVAKMVAGAYSMFSLAATIGVGDGASGQTAGDLEDNGGKGKCTSKTIFWATSAGWIAGDMFLKHRAKKQFEKLAKEYDTEAKNKEQKAGEDGSYQAQVRAFQYLREEQEQIKEQAKYRKFLQVAVIGGFAASLGFAIYEQTPAGWPGACKTVRDNENAQLDSTESTTTNVQTNNPPANTGGQTTVENDVDPMSFTSQMMRLGTSAQIAIGAGIMLALNGYLIYHADKEMSRASDNIEAIDEALETFAQYIAGFCPDGREDLNNERCYCYNEDGTQNENRTQSVICQNLFAADSINYALKNEKLKPLAEGPRQGCVTVTGQFDVDCRCRKMINNTTKQNACAKAPNTTAINAGLGAQLGAGQAMSTVGSLSQGANKALASLNPATLNSNATRSKKLVDSMLKQAKKNGVNMPTMDEFEKQAERMVMKLGNSRKLTNAGNPLAGRLAGVANETRPASLKNSLALAEKKAAFKKPTLTLSKSTGTVGSQNKGSGFKFNWNDQAASSGNKVQTFMDKKYKYKGSDIVKRDDISLWNVISKRYQTSGLRRLFGEDDE